MHSIEHLFSSTREFLQQAMPLTVEVLKALAAPIVAYAALRVSRQQVRINESKLRLDMYDRRLKVYGAVKGMLNAFYTNGTLTQGDLDTYREQVVEVDFLFREEVQAYVRELDRNARQVIVENHRLDVSAGRSKNADVTTRNRLDTLHRWLIEQPSNAKRIFQPSLSPEGVTKRGWLSRIYAVVAATCWHVGSALQRIWTIR